MPLVGGTLAFDFLNTGGGTIEPAADGEVLRDYADLLAWGRHARTLAGPAADALELVARRHAVDARGAHEQALATRRYLYQLFDALLAGRQPSASSLATLRADESAAIAHAQLVDRDGSFEWSWDADDGLMRPLWPVVHAATTLLTNGQMWRAKRCPGCGWWFLDETRNQSRRWCRMEDCGTAEKMRNYVARRAAKRTGTPAS